MNGRGRVNTDMFDAMAYITGPAQSQAPKWEDYFGQAFNFPTMQTGSIRAASDYTIGIQGIQREIQAELRRAGKSDNFRIRLVQERMHQYQVIVAYSYEHIDFEVVIPQHTLQCRKDLVHAILDKLKEYEDLWEE